MMLEKGDVMHRTRLLLAAIVIAMSAITPVMAASGLGGKPLAWIRFEDGPESFAGTPYLWLGRRQINITMDVQPAAGHVIDLLWGSKDDTRTAVMVVNGKPQTIEGGGYEGFRWKRVPVPPGVEGDSYRIALHQTGGKAAFLAEVRLTNPEGKAGGADPARSAAHRAKLATVEETAPPLPTDPLERSAEIAGFTISKVQRWLHQVALKKIEPDTGLYHPDGRFNYQDAWADCYPFLVWAAWLTDTEALNGPVRGALHAEIKHCAKGFFTDPKNTFGGSEYVKDGLIAIVEITGKDEWFERMKGIEEDIWEHARVDTPLGKIPSTNIEVNGEQLQALARLHTMTGEEKFLVWAQRLADYYLGNEDFVPKRLRDHGCEIIGGLGLLLGVESEVAPEKAKERLPRLKKMFDEILARGCNEDGIMYNTLGAKGGRLSDGWGYNYVGFLCYDMVASQPVYREHIVQTLRNLAKPKYKNYPWEGRSIDGYADSIEGGLYIMNRLPIAEGLAWADREVAANIVYRHAPHRLWGTMKLQSNGVRTAIIHALMHTRGTIARPWQQGLKLGAIDADDGIEIILKSDRPYQGTLVFDIPRHRQYMGFEKDWPRMNTVPEWFTVQPDEKHMYTVKGAAGEETTVHTGKALHAGLPVRLDAGDSVRLTVQPKAP
jgi:hypothetical protein